MGVHTDSWPVSSHSILGGFILVTTGLILTEGDVNYAPGDTRLLDYTIFCQALTIEYSDPPMNVGPSVLYVLNSQPTLTDTDTFAFNRNELLNDSRRFYEWNLHFYQGSRIEVSGCSDGNGSAQYYLIKGMAGFNNWRSNFESNPSVVDSFMLSSSCATAAYSFTEEDQYFVVFQSIEPESDNSLNVHVNVTFHRTKYAVDRDQYVEKRHFNASITSSVLTSFNGNTHILLVYGNSSESPEYWNNIQLDVDVNCEPRIWFYVVITIGPVVVTLLCVVCITCCICCVCRSKKKSEDRSPLLRDWDDPGTHHHSYYQYSERSRRLDPLTELAIATPESSNPHIAQFKEDLKQPSFQDEQLSFGSPKFSTFKP